MVVAAGCPGRIEPGGWEEFWVPVAGEACLPVAAVDDPVVVTAEQHGVVQGGGTAVLPGDDVVAVAPAWGSVAAGEGTTAVA